jgi:uncharacterized lipoprotein YmbA
MDHRAVVRRLLGLAASIGLAGCAVSDPTQYYALGRTEASSSTAGSAESRASASTPPSSVAGTGTVSIGVGPVILPGYLDRSQIVTRAGTDELELSMFHRWAEPLADGIARILAEEISARVPTERIFIFPWRGVVARVIQYQVVVAVLHFEGRPGGDVTLDTRWRILGRDGDELVFRRSTVTEAAAGPGYDPMVAAMARALVALGQEIAAEIRAMPAVKPDR